MFSDVQDVGCSANGLDAAFVEHHDIVRQNGWRG